MKKSAITRRGFVKRLSSGTLSAAILPTFLAGEAYKMAESTTLKDDKTSLPPFFDSTKYIGPDFPKRADYPKAVDLLSHMDRLGIERAVAWHTSARGLNPTTGNEQLLLEIELAGARERIIPSFVISPEFAEEKSLNHFVSIVKRNNIRAFHYFPHQSKLSAIAPVIRSIQSLNPVLFLDCFESLGKNDEDILSFTAEFPMVSVIFTNAMWVFLDPLYKLMEARKNIYVETSLQHIYLANEYIVKRFGAERLIFGSGYKSNNGASIAALAHAEITKDQFHQIAHGNLEQLLGIKSPLKGSREINGDRLWHRLLRNEKPGQDFLDSHTHLCRTTGIWEDHDKVELDSHAQHAISQMDRLGIHSMYIAEYTVYPPDLEKGKTYLEKGLSKYGDRFHGYFSGLAFKLEKKEKLIPRLDDLFSRSFYVGFKMHNSHWNIPVTDPDFIPLWEYADNHRLPILLHTWNDNVDAPKMLQDIVPKYPNAIFILGHSGNTDRPDAEKLALENPNVYLEWCGSFVDPTDWRETLERLGNRQLLYGSDFVSWESRWGHDPSWEMGRLLSLDVPDETLLPVLGTNMKRILAQKR